MGSCGLSGFPWRIRFKRDFAMSQALDPSASARKRLNIRISILLAAAGLMAVLTAATSPYSTACIALPTLAALAVFAVFSMVLHSWVGDNLLGELGFLYVGLILAYTIFPAFSFLVIDLSKASGWVWQNLSLLLPSPVELGTHLWRHVLFLFAVSLGYLLMRGRKSPQMATTQNTGDKDDRIVIFLFALVAICTLSTWLMSAPVHTYVDSYTRYDHLSTLPRKFVSLCARMQQGLYVSLITFLFINHKRYKLLIGPVILAMAVYDVVFSFGSRIEALFVLLMGICLYHYFIRPISLKKGLLACIAIVLLFSTIEVLRSNEFDLGKAQATTADRGFQPASEFGAVYFTSFHLYQERDQGALPPKEWPMFFNDFISLVTPNDFVRWSPQHWYAKAYFPDSVVPPETLGPIADSAIWGGEFDLLLRGLINGMFFAYLIRWFISRKGKWWAVAVYVFCYATCIMTLKYSVFYHLNPLLKTFLPTALFVEAYKKFLSRSSPSEASSAK